MEMNTACIDVKIFGQPTVTDTGRSNNFELELYFYLDTVNLSDKIIILLQSIITVTIYFNLYKHDLKFKSKIEKK